jgi:hypothetical protein
MKCKKAFLVSGLLLLSKVMAAEMNPVDTSVDGSNSSELAMLVSGQINRIISNGMSGTVTSSTDQEAEDKTFEEYLGRRLSSLVPMQTKEEVDLFHRKWVGKTEELHREVMESNQRVVELLRNLEEDRQRASVEVQGGSKK